MDGAKTTLCGWVYRHGGVVCSWLFCICLQAATYATLKKWSLQVPHFLGPCICHWPLGSQRRPCSQVSVWSWVLRGRFSRNLVDTPKPMGNFSSHYHSKKVQRFGQGDIISGNPSKRVIYPLWYKGICTAALPKWNQLNCLEKSRDRRYEVCMTLHSNKCEKNCQKTIHNWTFLYTDLLYSSTLKGAIDDSTCTTEHQKKQKSKVLLFNLGVLRPRVYIVNSRWLKHHTQVLDGEVSFILLAQNASMARFWVVPLDYFQFELTSYGFKLHTDSWTPQTTAECRRICKSPHQKHPFAEWNAETSKKQITGFSGTCWW